MGLFRNLPAIFGFVAMLVILSVQAFAAEIPEAATPQIDPPFTLGYWKQVAGDAGRLAVAPARWEKKEWLTAAAVSGVTVGLFWADEEIRRTVQRNRSDFTDKVSDVAFNFGDPVVTLPTVGLFYLYGALADAPRARRTGLLGLESLLVANLFTQTLKVASRRHRPNSGDSAFHWDGPGLSSRADSGDPDGFSFPSGHATSAFAVASVIASEYEDVRWVPVVAYGASLLTALSRVNDNEHWASDVVFGSAIGYFTGKAIHRMHRRPEPSRFRIVPEAAGDYLGLRWTCRL